MVSVEHQVYVDFFVNSRTLAPELLRRCARIDLPHHHITGPSKDLTETTSIEYRVDATLILRDAAYAVTSAIIVEVQLHTDERKRFTWPSYVAGLRAQLQCPVYLLVYTNTPYMAHWCAHTLEIGHPGYALTPIVIQQAELPRSVDRELVQTLPELGLLTSIAHADRDLASDTIKAIDLLPSDRKKLYWDVLLSRLPAAMRAALLEEQMQGYQYQSDFARKYVAEGLAKGIARGRVKTLRETVVKLVERQPPEIVESVRAAIRIVKDEKRLSALVDALIASRGPAAARRVLRTQLALDL